ncbi:MAG: S41 family peptidase [Deltaproteobacteria bacterium]|nr:S41 family peptidase [Deltaproteobacteria bacterium]MCB9488205.1 S41 family peptidase [Deltaproteobacteria bacterium]
MKRRPLLVLLAVTVMATTILTASYAQAISSASKDAQRAFRLFVQVINAVETKYVEDVDLMDMVEYAISGMLANLDPHSAYLDEEEFREMQVRTHGAFGGLGIEISMTEGYIEIVSPIEGTPAERAGLEPKDLIVRIDGEITKGMKITEAVEKLRGEPGTSVTLTIYRAEEVRTFDVTLERAIIQVESVKHRVMGDGVGYVRITQFNENAGDGLVEAIDEMNMETGGMTGLVLDLRYNPGGLLDQAGAVADQFLEQGLVVYTSGRVKQLNDAIAATPGGAYTRGPLVVLVNNGSASASEIVAGALQDHERAVVIGDQTFGKASVQTVFPIGDADLRAGIRLTIAKYFTPKGRDIQAKGIEPDYYVEQTHDDDEIEGMGPPEMREADYRNRLKNLDETIMTEEELAAANEADAHRELPDLAEGEEMVMGPKGELVDDRQLAQALKVLKAWPKYSKTAWASGT